MYKITFTYDSWTWKYDLYCDKQGERELGKTLYFFMNTFGCFSILYLLDRIGRRNTAYFTAIVVVTVMSIASVVPHWYVGMLAMGLANGCEGCFSNLFNVIMSESSCKN